MPVLHLMQQMCAISKRTESSEPSTLLVPQHMTLASSGTLYPSTLLILQAYNDHDHELFNLLAIAVQQDSS